MLLDHDDDENVVFVARGAPRRWFQLSEEFGISNAPTRFAVVTFRMQALPAENRVEGAVSLASLPGPSDVQRQIPIVAVHIRMPFPDTDSTSTPHIEISPKGAAKLTAWFSQNETAWFEIPSSQCSFNFVAKFA